MDKLAIGILAHVDAGKTTLSEALLYRSGQLKKLGRVDHKNAFLDTDALERERGITIFSKQALFTVDDLEITLLDTPGHADFSSEMERTLQVLDYAVLVVNGVDGVQGHTQTLWQLLKQYEIPVFLFINKMDLAGAEHTSLIENLREQLSDTCVDFSWREGEWEERFWENVAVCGEEAFNQYLALGQVEERRIAEMIHRRQLFPCFFGSALKLDGVDSFLRALARYTLPPSYPLNDFAAKVYKISRDPQENRLTHLKITGGQLKVKDLVSNGWSAAMNGKNPTDGGRSAAPDTQNTDHLVEIPIWEEKVDQIRIYSGVKYQTADWVSAGTVCAVTGLDHTFPGQGLGREPSSRPPLLEPVITYQVLLAGECDPYDALLKLRQLEEEDPQLRLVWNEGLRAIHIQLMGEIQLEILKRQILERLGLSVTFSEGSIAYRETIASPVEGIGHFEPLRHYAEVHLLLEPGERGCGLQFAADLSEDLLDGSWQRLILTHLEEKEHIGVLTGSGITDLKITLIAGRAHTKHTEGGDFRQATYRAVRQGLKKAKSVLLEPYYEFQMELPPENVGRAMADMRIRGGDFEAPQLEQGVSILVGTVPVASMIGYQTELLSYTGGQGRLFCTPKGYERCHNEEEVIEHRGYDSETDIHNPTGSVFCTHGSGDLVKWDQVEDHMHVESPLRLKTEEEEICPRISVEERACSKIELTEEELDGLYRKSVIFNKPKYKNTPVKVKASEGEADPAVLKELERKGSKSKEEYLLVDGYNIIFAWEELKQLAETNIESARNKLMDILCNYQGYKKCKLILVFDAYNVPRNGGEVLKYNNIYVVYTKEAETADQYIEKTVHKMGRGADVVVATSDALEQLIIMGQGARRMSAKGLLEEIEHMLKEIREVYLGSEKGGQQYLFDYMTKDMAAYFEAVRLGKETYYGGDGTTK